MKKAIIATLAMFVCSGPVLAEPQAPRFELNQKAWIQSLKQLQVINEGAKPVRLQVNQEGKPVNSDGTQLISEKKGSPSRRQVSGECICQETKTVRNDRGDEATECVRSSWRPGTIYEDTPVVRRYHIADPERWARSKASSASAGVGIGAGLGLGTALGGVTGLMLKYVAKARTPVAAAVGVSVGVLTGLGAGFFFGSRAAGPAYDRALDDAKRNPEFEKRHTETKPVGSFDHTPPLFGTPCSLGGI